MPEAAPWIVERLSEAHETALFDCGEPVLDEHLRRYARSNDQSGIGRTYVATLPGDLLVLGYFSLHHGAVAFEVLDAPARAELGRHPVPVVRIPRLAVDRTQQGRGMGGMLLVDALVRAARISEGLDVRAIESEARDERARRFYEHYGFQSMVDDPDRMYLSMLVVRTAFPPAALA